MDNQYHKIPIKSTVLVLNSDYNPINLCSGRRAIILLLKQKAHLISQKVIRLIDYVRIPYRKLSTPKPTKSSIYKRDGYKCQYCGCTKNLTLDHIIPKSKGGSDSFANLVVACNSCNTKKGNKLLEQTDMKLLKQPKEPLNRVFLSIQTSNIPEWMEYSYN